MFICFFLYSLYCNTFHIKYMYLKKAKKITINKCEVTQTKKYYFVKSIVIVTFDHNHFIFTT